jgi:hypothetical protein
MMGGAVAVKGTLLMKRFAVLTWMKKMWRRVSRGPLRSFTNLFKTMQEALKELTSQMPKRRQ